MSLCITRAHGGSLGHYFVHPFLQLWTTCASWDVMRSVLFWLAEIAATRYASCLWSFMIIWTLEDEARDYGRVIFASVRWRKGYIRSSIFFSHFLRLSRWVIVIRHRAVMSLVEMRMYGYGYKILGDSCTLSLYDSKTIASTARSGNPPPNGFSS